MPKISPEKKKEYNLKYRKKKKEKTSEDPTIEIKKVTFAEKIDDIIETKAGIEPKIETEIETEPKIETEIENDDGTYTIDTETMNYLIECMNKKESKEITKEITNDEIKATTSNDSGFFFQVKQAMYQQLAITVPMIALKLIVDGVKLSMPLGIPNIINLPFQQRELQSKSSPIRVVNVE